MNVDPRTLERSIRGTGERQERFRLEHESLASQRALIDAIEGMSENMRRELREIRVAVKSTDARLAALNAGALTAAVIAAANAIIPEDLKTDWKNKVDGLLRPNGPYGEAAVAARAMASASPPVGHAVQEALERPRTVEEITAELSAILSAGRTTPVGG
jgi:hypothetical protein